MEDAKKEEKEAAETVKKAKAAEGAKGPDAAVAGEAGETPKGSEAEADAAKDDGKTPKGVPGRLADLPPCEQIEAMKKEAAAVDPDEVAKK